MIDPEILKKKAQRVLERLKWRIKNREDYSDVTVCPEWSKDSKAFTEWYMAQPHVGKPNMQLDKDLLSTSHKVYSPETCCLLPQAINKLLTIKNSNKELPTGVHLHGRKYIAQYTAFGVTERLPPRETPEEAREDYLQAKKAHVKYLVTESPYAALLAPKVVSAILAWDRF